MFDALTYAGNLDNLPRPRRRPAVPFVKGNITDREAVTAALAGHDVVVHFAAESHVDRSIVSADEFVHTNCDGTNVMWTPPGEPRSSGSCTSHRRGIRLHRRRLVHGDRPAPASVAVLGIQGRLGPDRPRLPRTYGLPVVVTRSPNNFGPYQYPEKVIPLFVTNLLDGVKSRSTATA